MSYAISKRRKVEILCTNMSLNKFSRFLPGFRNETWLRENIEFSRVSGNDGKYVIPMHRKN